jgi:hypothetical protein
LLTSDDLYVVATTGQQQPRRVTRQPWWQTGFAWSKDGRRLVAISSRNSYKPEIFEFPLDGSEPHRAGELDVARGSEPTPARGKGSLAWVRDLSEQYLANASGSIPSASEVFDEFGGG